MTEATYEQLLYWWERGAEAEYLSNEWHEATQAVMSLPGYPLAYSPDEGDILIADVIDKVSTSVVH